MIRYDEEKKLLALETAHDTYLIGLALASPVHLYWGDKIEMRDVDANEFTSHSSFDAEIWRECLEYPVWDGRTFGNTCLRADRPLDLMLEKVCVAGDEAVIHLHEKGGTQLRLIYRVHAKQDVIEKHAEICSGNAPLKLRRFDSGACCLPQMQGRWRAHYTVGSWAGEFRRRDVMLGEGELRLQSTRGMSGPHMNPSLVFTDTQHEEQGTACAAVLGWSGCWQITASGTVFGHTRVTAGFDDTDLSICLNVGDTQTTPPLYLCRSGAGMGGLSRRLHDLERQVLAPSSRMRRVLYNSWEATQFNVNAAEQMALAERAASMGVELFVVDDGWFGGRMNDTAGLGDWTVNADKFPHGLEELITHVKGLGMDFGLWVEPESVNPDSDLYRAHPEWIHRLTDREPMQLRNQYLLDFSRAQVEQFALDMLRGLLVRYRITYLKWDMNRAFTDICEQLTPFVREAHTLAVYRILETLRLEFPDVEIEACSGGGARVDLGMMCRTDQFWPSDNTDPYERLFIQDGCSLCYAPAMTSCWVTDTPACDHRDGCDDLVYKFHVASCGSLGIGADISRFTAAQIAICREQVAAYKRIRHLVQQGDHYRLGSPAKDDVTAVEFCRKDGGECVLLAFIHSQKYGERFPRIRLRGLDPHARYHCEQTGEMSGSTLMHYGVAPKLKGDFDSAMWHFVRV